MLARIEVPCACGDAAPVTAQGPGPCPRCGTEPSAQALGTIPRRFAFRVWHIAVPALGTCAAVALACYSYATQATSYRSVFQDLGLRALPPATNLAMNTIPVYGAYWAIAASALFLVLLVRQRIRRARAVGLWPGHLLLWLILLTAILDALLSEALYRPWIEILHRDLH